MTRIGNSVKPATLDSSRTYKATLDQYRIVDSLYPDPKTGEKVKQLLVIWSIGDGVATDYLAIRVGSRANGNPAKLKTMLNAIADFEPDRKLWFDPDTREWGYEFDEGAPGYAILTKGMEVGIIGHMKPVPAKDGAGPPKLFPRIDEYVKVPPR